MKGDFAAMSDQASPNPLPDDLTIAEILAQSAPVKPRRARKRGSAKNLRFVISVAKKYQNRGLPLLDLIGEGNLGLLTAARKFDPDQGVKFIS